MCHKASDEVAFVVFDEVAVMLCILLLTLLLLCCSILMGYDWEGWTLYCLRYSVKHLVRRVATSTSTGENHGILGSQ